MIVAVFNVYLVLLFEVNTILIGLISISAVLSVLAVLSRSERK